MATFGDYRDRLKDFAAFIGFKVIEEDIYPIAIQKTKPGVNNEYQLTDAIKKLIDDQKKVYYKQIDGTHIDIGTIQDLQKANTFHSQH